MIDFIEGPLWYAASAVFVAGTLWRLAALLRGRRQVADPARGSPALGALQGMLSYMLPRRPFRANRSVRVVFVAGYLFHLGLLALILFGPPHVAFIRERILGAGWTPLPYWAFIVVAEVAVGALLLLWIRRATDPVTRTISRRDDHIAAGLTMAAMLTGCFALGEGMPALRALHMLAVEAWLVYFPFGSLFHAFSWALSRGHTGALFARRGIRA